MSTIKYWLDRTAFVLYAEAVRLRDILQLITITKLGKYVVFSALVAIVAFLYLWTGLTIYVLQSST